MVRRRFTPKLRTFVAVFLFCAAVVILSGGIRAVSSFTRETGISPATLYSLLSGGTAGLVPIDDRVNVALLGIGGGSHEGSDLTDTILILSFNIKSRAMGMISVPRDLWSDSLKDKVNSAYYYGQEKKKGGGLVLSKAIISDMVGLPVQYGIVFDFTKFTHVIDLVGGITVDVPQAFTDSQYPIAGKENDPCGGDPAYACRYETLRFDAGVERMDGKRALAYVRSRHAEGGEGNDFARGRRQQQVIVALKDRLVSRDIIANPSALMKLYRAFDDATDTDMNMGQLLTVGSMFVHTPKEAITRISIEPYLYEPPVSWYGRYVLLPKDSFAAIREAVRKELR